MVARADGRPWSAARGLLVGLLRSLPLAPLQSPPQPTRSSSLRDGRAEYGRGVKFLILTERDLQEALPMRDAVQAMKDAFGALSAGEAVAPQRTHLEVPERDAVSLLMGAFVPSMGLATKVVSVFPHNPREGKPIVTGLVEVLDPETGEPAALIDGTALTAWRTGAASGAATDLLAREDASTGALIGCGAQGRTQLLAVDAVRDLSEVRVAGRSLESAERFCREMQPRVRPRLTAVASAREAVRGADIVCTATTSRTPVLDGDDLVEGAHVNAVGSFTLDMLELDPRTIERSTVFVDEVEAALEEAGELVYAERCRATSRERWTPLGLVARGSAAGRRSAEEITLFKSVGHAVQDVAAASRALARARELGLGIQVDLAAESLRQEDVPGEDASWQEIQDFALTYDGYAAHGSLEGVEAVVRRGDPTTIPELRTCLFYQQRSWRNQGFDPDAESMEHIRGLVRRLRELARPSRG